MVYLHTGPMGVHRACFFIARAGRAATPERNRSGNQPPILCILPLVAHQLASARLFCATGGVLVRSARLTRYVRLFFCPSPGESRSSKRRSGGTPVARDSALPSASLATGRSAELVGHRATSP